VPKITVSVQSLKISHSQQISGKMSLRKREKSFTKNVQRKT